MMRLLLFLLLSVPLCAAVENLQLLGATSTQIVVSYTSPSLAACTLEASKESDYTPLALDVDTLHYTGAASDSRAGNVSTGRHRIFVIGRQGPSAIEQSLDGYHRSRALQADTNYHIRVTCGGDTATITARTMNIRLGGSRGEALAVHGSDLWRYKQVTVNKVANPEFNDPYTGALIKNPPALVGFGYSQSTATIGDGYSPTGCNVTLTGVKGSCKFAAAAGTNWSATAGTTTDAIDADDNNFATYSGTSQDKLWLRLGSGKYPTHSTLGATLSFQNLHFSAKTSDPSGEGGWMRVCLTADGVTCISPALRVTLSDTKAVYSVCADSPCTVKDNPGDVMHDWMPGLVPGAARVYNEAGSLTTLKFAGSNLEAACNDLIVGESINVYDSRTNGVNPYTIPVSAKSCGSSPPQITIPSGYDLAHNGTTGVTFWRTDGVTGARYGALVWKESTTSGSTISIDLPLWRAATTPAYTLAFGSGGFGKRCQNVPTAGGYYLCMTSSDANMIIGVKPGVDGLDIVNYGIAGWRGDLISAGLSNTGYLTGSSAAANDALWDDEVPGVFYMYFNAAAGCGPVIVKMTLSLATPAAPDPDGSAYPGGTRVRTAGIASAVILTPCGSGASDFSLNTQRGRISSEWASLGNMFPSCSLEAVQGLTLIETCKAGSQDSHGFVFAYDLGNRLPAGGGFVGTRGGNTQQAFGGFLVSANHASRWCGLHTYQNPLSAAGTPFALVELGTKAPMTVTVDTALSACNSRSTPGTCGACPDVTVDGFNYSGKNWCATINVSSSCASVSAPAGCTDGDPISSGADESPSLKWYQPLKVGDVIRRGNDHSKMLVKNSQTQWVVLRGWGYQSSSTSADAWAPQTHGSGLTWSTWCGGQAKDPLTTAIETPWGLAWYFGNDPNGTNPAYTFLNRFQNHGFHATNYGVFPDYTLGKFDFSDPASNAASLTSGSYLQPPTAFAGKATTCTGNACEKHPGANQVLGDTSWFSDVHPRLFHPSGSAAVALAPGKTFIYQYNGAAAISPKHFDLEAYMGRYPFKRADTISDAASDTGKKCVAPVANDCFSGSTAGKMYFVNEVFDTTFIPLATCRESQFGTINGDACLGPSNGIGASVSQWRVPSSNGLAVWNGSQQRAVSREWRTYREAATENVKADPTGTALLARALWYILPPPFPGVDTRNRGTFAGVPVDIASVPAGTDNVLVQFGYDGTFQCSRNRDNTCYAESAELNESNPYQFDHEPLTGLSCASSCTVTLPAISDRVLYWRTIFRSGGTVISTGLTNVQAVP